MKSYTENITQINISVSYNYFVTPQFSLHGGAYLGLLLSAKEKDNLSNKTYDMSNNTMDFGFLAGPSYKITETIDAQFRYNYGILDLESRQSSKWMSRFFQIGISYQIK